MNLRTLLALGLTLVGTGCSPAPVNHAGELNAAASLPASFDFEAQGLHVVSSLINKKQGTMSTLYGNAAGRAHATAAPAGAYPAGLVLALVTWRQQPDPRWYGAKIPANLQTVELVKTVPAAASPAVRYQLFRGPDLQPATPADTLQQSQRAAYILAQQASVIP
jgi:hypothetical protein